MLDTGIVGRLLADDGPAWRRFAPYSGSVGLSAIVALEHRHGIAESKAADSNLRSWQRFLDSGGVVVTPFDGDAADTAGILRHAMTRKGMAMGSYDLLIAAQALRRDAVLVTLDAGFARLDGLRQEDWAGT
jgi:tRNA(fMet)-specific endonuclease VapC